jgi:hypothetical protein
MLLLPLIAGCVSSRNDVVANPLASPGLEFVGVDGRFKNASWLNVGVRRTSRDVLCVPSPQPLSPVPPAITPLRLVPFDHQVPSIESLARQVQFRRIKFHNGVAGMAVLGAPDMSEVALGPADGKRVVPRGSYRVCLYFRRGDCDESVADSASVLCSAPIELEEDSEFWRETQLRDEQLNFPWSGRDDWGPIGVAEAAATRAP